MTKTKKVTVRPLTRQHAGAPGYDRRMLDKAIELLKRGKKTMTRVGWEPGETDEDWTRAVTYFLTEIEQDREMVPK